MFNDELKSLWGFHPMQEAYFNSLLGDNSQLVPARVVSASHDQFRVLLLGMMEEKFAKVRGQYYHQGDDWPAVGDWVAVELTEGDHQYLPIEGTLPRLTELKRSDPVRGFQTLVANVDHIGLVTSFNQDFNLRRLERGLAMIAESGAAPFIVVNKLDLVDDAKAESLLQELVERLGHVAIFSCSAQTGDGIDDLKDNFEQGKTIAFLGMSGVGKSSVINALVGQELMATSGIREDDARGRHTTTHREMVLTAADFWIVDNPGIREFSYFGDEESLAGSFGDISNLMARCRFGNCTHESEPGCQIQSALESGELAQDRWENYLKMRREAEFHLNKGNKAYHSEKRKIWVKRTMDLRSRLKAKGRK